MKYWYIYFIIFCLASVTLLPTALGGTIFSAGQKSLYSSALAHKKGDILTILINENTLASQQANTDLNKSTEIKGALQLSWTQVTNFLGINNNDKFNSDNTLKGSDKFLGKGSTQRQSKIVARISATVFDVLDNGNLVIRGQHNMSVNGDDQELVIVGMVRQEDISKENTLESASIANAKITLSGKGNVQQEQQKGLIPSLFGWLF